MLPYKRYVATQLLQLAEQYLDQDQQSLRNACSSQGKPIGYETEDHAFSHGTLWRWLAYLGAMTVSLNTGIELLLKAVPESTVFRFTGSCSPRKARSEVRSQTLRHARRLLNLIRHWDTVFPKQRFFPSFATRVRPP